MTKTSTPDAGVEQRLRRTLHMVAGTVTAENHPAPLVMAPRSAQPTGSSAPRHTRVGLALGGAAIALTVAAAAWVNTGPEYVDTIPPETIITEGSVDGNRYLLVETRRTQCGRPAEGVELVEESKNILGSEWNTMGARYGEPTQCGADTRQYLSNPALYNDSGTVVGDSFVWLWSVHPDVTAVRVTSGNFTSELPVYPVDGAGYALFEIPKGMTRFTAQLLIGDEAVRGSVEVQTVPARR